MVETMEQQIKKYLELKEQINALEEQKKEIANKFKAGLSAFGVAALKVPVGDKSYQLKIVSRTTHSCQWEAFKAVHAEIYAQFVSDGSSTYVDVRPVRNDVAEEVEAAPEA